MSKLPIQNSVIEETDSHTQMDLFKTPQKGVQTHNNQGAQVIYQNFAQAQQHLQGIEAIDYYLAVKLNHLYNRSDDCDILFHVLLALSESQRNGHSCLAIESIANKTLWHSSSIMALTVNNELNEQNKPGYCFPSADELNSLLNDFRTPEQTSTPDKLTNNLIVLEFEQLYLRRYWLFERQLADMLVNKLSENISSDQQLIAGIMSQLFNHNTLTDTEVDWQKVAVANALNKSFSIIAGGPGTGKTYTVTKLLAGLLMLDPTLNVEMVAPTGKAAQRLSESIVKATQNFKQQGLITDEVLEAIPKTAATIHRLLGVIKNSPNFRHDKQRPLTADVLLIDEVSMVDLPMMTRIFRATKPDCRLILLGDADQLPSVAIGSVLADLAPYQTSQYSAFNSAYIDKTCALRLPSFCKQPSVDYLTYLTKSRRFKTGGGIGLLAENVIKGKGQQAWQLLAKSGNCELTLVDNTPLGEYIKQLTENHYRAMFNAESVEQAFQILDKFRILVPTRNGETGLENLNLLVEQQLQKQNLIPKKQPLYHGRPIMISQNHYGVNLFNGDIGILFKDKQQRLMAYFPEGDGYRAVSISRLPKFDTVYAMTIHKTQGSEFDHVALILPEKGAERILSRELIYTGITRAKQHLQVFSNQPTFVSGVQQKVSRASGLTTRVLNLLETTKHQL